MEKQKEQKCRRLIVAGKTGVGKSSLGNSLFDDRVFEARCKLTSITKEAQSHSKIVEDSLLTVIDAPGFSDTNEDVDIDSEMTNCIKLSMPGPHVIVYVVNIGRLTKEEYMSFTTFIDKFGNDIDKYCLLVLTRFDDYKRDYDTTDFDLEDFLKDLPTQFQSLLKNTFEKRYFPFDNTLSGRTAQEQVVRFMQKVNDVIAANGGNYYTNEDFRKAEIAHTQKKEEQHQKERRQKEEEMERIRCEERDKNLKRFQEEMKKEKKRTDKLRETCDKNVQDMQNEIENVKKQTQKEIESLKAKESNNSLSPEGVLLQMGEIARLGNNLFSVGQSLGNVISKGKSAFESFTRKSETETTGSLHTNSNPMTLEYSSVLGYPEVIYNRPKPTSLNDRIIKMPLDQYLHGNINLKTHI